jgi:histidinol-phosphate/aromatic aminotransferase/cobyric acid decarboxylase-like protein
VPKINPHIQSVNRHRTPYSPLDRVRLHASERDLRYSDSMMDYFKGLIDCSTVRLYPDNDLTVELLSEFSGIHRDYITAFDGSDRALRDLFHVFGVSGSEMVMWEKSFPMYRVYADMFGIKVRSMVADYPNRPLGILYGNKKLPSTVADYPKRPLHKLIPLINSNTSIVIISHPDTPYGNLYEYSELMRLLSVCEQFDCLLIVDEAYIEFSSVCQSLELYARHSNNLIVVRTLSKGYGSAGIRVGYTISNKRNAELLRTVSSMNTITGIGNCWIKSCIEYKSELISYYSTVEHNRRRFVVNCHIHGIPVIDGAAGFVHVGVILSDAFVSRVVEINGSTYTRVSIPADEDNFCRLLKEVLSYDKNS